MKVFVSALFVYMTLDIASTVAHFQKREVTNRDSNHEKNVTLANHPVLIVISYDGFRYDYFNKPENGTPYLNQLKKSGSHVPYMKNQFLTKTFPNHMSIATGLYVEAHGVVDNWFYDPVLNRTLNARDEELWNFNNSTLPLWTVNELEGEGRKSGVMMWPGSNHPFGVNNTLPSRVVDWNASIPFEWRVDEVISWITDKENPLNLVFLYFEEPDEFAHGFGVDSPQTIQQIERVDNVTGYLIKKLESLNIFNRVNLILLSDHGFQEVRQDHIINITSIIDSSLYDRYGSSPMLQINPKNGKLDEVYSAFKRASEKENTFHVYRKEEIPTHWHYSKNRRIMPIILLAELGYVFDDFYQTMEQYNKKYNRTANITNVYGTHGYDNLQLPMHPFFIAHGPLFRSDYQASPFENIDLFPLICKIMNISTPPNNGSLQNVSPILAKKGFNITSPVGWVFGAALIVGLTILLGIMSLMVSRKRNNHRSLLAEGGYRFINNQDFRDSTDSLDIQIESQQLNGNGVQINPNKEEYQSLLMSSSTEEL